jgi:predicted amidohydrolase
MDSISVALSQTAGKFGEPEAALHLLDAEAARAAAGGATMLVLPELFLTGYNLGQARVRRLAEPANGALIGSAREVARSHGIALVFGYPEQTAAGVANAAMLIGENGAILLNYRKAHLFGALDRDMFEIRGETFPVADYHGWRVGLAICYDIEITETARLFALAGADCMLVPTALMEPYDIVPRAVIPTRAYENQIYLGYANHCGAEGDIAYIGQSCICGPDGAVLAAAGSGAELIMARFERAHLDRVRARDPLLADRRPELYRPLAADRPA